MTNVLGVLLVASAGLPVGSSVSLGLGLWLPGIDAAVPSQVIDGGTINEDNVFLATQQATGTPAMGFGDDLFERVIVTERSKPVGFLLSEYVWSIELWNTCRRSTRELTGIGISGVGGLQITGPSSMAYYPWQSQIYTAILPLSGDPTIDTTVTWTFTGAAGADQHVTGSRVVVFPHRPDWSQPWTETTEYLTSILTAYVGAEQRRSLRTTPRYSASFQVMSTSEQETSLLGNLVYGRQTKLLGVPWWPESSPLLAPVSSGAFDLPVDPTNRRSFVEGGLLLIWSDFLNWEAFNITSVVGSTITIGTPTTKGWPIGTRVIPMRLGRFADLSLSRPTNWVSSGKFDFLCEAI